MTQSHSLQTPKCMSFGIKLSKNIINTSVSIPQAAAPAAVPRHVAVAANAAVLLGFRPPIASAVPRGCLGEKHCLKQMTDRRIDFQWICIYIYHIRYMYLNIISISISLSIYLFIDKYVYIYIHGYIYIYY